MAVTEETLQLARELRIIIDQHVDDATRDIVRSWARAWQGVIRDWDDARRAIAAAYEAGQKPRIGQLVRLRQVSSALEASRDQIEALGERAGVRVLRDVELMTEQTVAQHLQILRSQLPPGSAGTLLRVELNRVDPAQIRWIVERVTEQVTSKGAKFGPIGEQALRDRLVRAVQLGLNPRTAARDILEQGRFLTQMRGGFTATLNDAMIIARTEMLDATRAAAFEADKANDSTLQEWMWLAELDTRTCPSCWSMHGTRHPLDEPGPDDHQQGRCTRMTVTKSWKDLGFDLPEPDPVTPDARETFARLSPEDQLAVMGPDRLALLDSGAITWEQLSMLRHTRGWRRSFAPTPVRALSRQAAG